MSQHCRYPLPLRHAAVAFATLVAVGGCRAPAPSVTARPLGSGVPVYRPTGGDSAVRRAPAMPPLDSVTLQDAIRLTLLHSPELAAFNWEARAREARAVEALRFRNPSLEYLAEDLGATGRLGTQPDLNAVQRQTTIQLSQLVELGGKRGLRGQVAARERDAAEWDYEAARIDALTGAAHAFVDLLAAQQMVELTTRTDALVTDVEQAVSARVLAGNVSPIEASRAQAARALSRVELTRAQGSLTAGRAHLVAFWGQTQATFSGAIGGLDAIREVPAFEQLQEQLGQNPELAAWASRTAARRAALSLERRRRLPDVLVAGGYRTFTDLSVSAYQIGASLPIPIFNRNSDAVSEARSLANKAEAEARAAQARTSAALASAYAAMTGARGEVLALRETVLPRSREAFALITEGYRLGKFGYLEVLDAQRTLIASEERYLRALSEYHKSVADVERLIGTPLAVATSR